jgi:hypothetical protein
METLYISGGATVEVLGHLSIGTELLNSQVRVAGSLECREGAGTVAGGEIWVYEGMKVRVLGAAGSESQTVIYLGAHYFKLKEAEDLIKAEGIDEKMAEIDGKLKEIQAEILNFSGSAPEGAGRAHQEKYLAAIEKKKSLQLELEKFQARKDSILSAVPQNKDVALVVEEMILPGVTIKYKDTVWTLKEPQRAIEVRWNAATSNLISRRL